MTLTRKDATATVLTGLVVLTFIAAHQGWNVPLIGSSYRWAAVVVFALGAVTCGLGNKDLGEDADAVHGARSHSARRSSCWRW